MTVIDGATLATTDVPIGGYYPLSDSGQFGHQQDLRSQPIATAILPARAPNGTVSVIDGATLAYTSVPAGSTSLRHSASIR